MDTLPNTPVGTATPALGEQPKKYIRTFAGDMETVKQGGIPELSPLTPAERIVAGSPLPPAPVAPVAPPPVVAKPAYAPPAPENAPLKTYATDFSDRMRETHASAATVLAAEQDVQLPAPKGSLDTPPRHTLMHLVIGGLLVAAGIAGAAYAFLSAKPEAPVLTAPVIPAPIFFDEKEELTGSGSALLVAIASSANRPITTGSVRLLYKKSAAGFENVFAVLPLPVPEVVRRNIQAEGSMAGVVSAGGTQSPFFILAVTGYSNTFSGMLDWESQLPHDLRDLFPAYVTPVVPVLEPAATSTATSTSAASTTPAKPAIAQSTSTPPVVAVSNPTAAVFSDATAGTHDLRAYRDAAGRETLVYGYWNQATLIIARDSAAFTEIISRLSTARLKDVP